MTQTRDITLAGHTYAVPPLPLAITIPLYPILRKLEMSGFAERWGGGEPSDEDMADIAMVAFLCVKGCDPEFTAAKFYDLAIMPSQLFQA